MDSSSEVVLFPLENGWVWYGRTDRKGFGELVRLSETDFKAEEKIAGLSYSAAVKKVQERLTADACS